MGGIKSRQAGVWVGAFEPSLGYCTSESAEDWIRGKNFNGFLQVKGGDLCCPLGKNHNSVRVQMIVSSELGVHCF